MGRFFFQNASLLMCYCSFEIRQFYFLNTESEMHEIEELLMFKSARKTQHVTQIIEVDLRAYTVLRTLQCFKWIFPLQIVCQFSSYPMGNFNRLFFHIICAEVQADC